MESAQNLTDSPPDTSCQITKYQRVTDILNPLGPGVKVSFTILKFTYLWFLLYCNSKLHTEVASPFLSYCATVSIAKNGKLDNAIINLTNWGFRYHRLPD